MRRCWLILMLMIVVMSGCVRRPKGVLSDKKMVPVLAEMEVAEGYLHNGNIYDNREQMRERILEGILESHHIKRADFDSTMKWYGENPDVYYKLGSSINAQIELLARDYAGDNADLSDVNSPNLWPYLPMTYVDAKNGSRIIRFSMPGADLIPGESLKWRLRLRKEADASMLLGVDYDNGTSAYLSQRQNGRKNLEIELQTDTALSVKRVFGHVSFFDSDDLPLWADSIMITAAPLDSNKYFNINRRRIIHKPLKRLKQIPVITDSIDD